jgi:hypothetical protein
MIAALSSAWDAQRKRVPFFFLQGETCIKPTATAALMVLVLTSAIKRPDVTEITHREQNVTREGVNQKEKEGRFQ